MSDRDDIDVVSSEEKTEDNSFDESNAIYSTKQKINHAIRQNPLTHLGEKSEKPTLLERLKRAFSTEDTYGGGFIADNEPSDGGLIEDPVDLFGNIFSRMKHNDADDADGEEQTEEFPENEAVQESETTENTDELTEDGITSEEEELAIINSVLDGLPVEEAIKQAEEMVQQQSEFDEDDEFNFIPDSEDEEIEESEITDDTCEELSDEEEFDDEDEEFYLEDDYLFDESDDELDEESQIDVNSEVEKIEETAEETVIEENSKEEKAEETATEENSEEEKTEKDAPEENSEETAEETAIEENSEEEKSEETATEENSEEEKSEETVTEENSEEEKAEETASEENAEEEKEEETATEENSEEETAEETVIEENSEEETAEETVIEENSEEETAEETATEENSEEEKAEETATEEDAKEEKAEETEENTAENSSKAAAVKDSAVLKVKGLFSKTKNKLVELWNTKDDGTVEDSKKLSAEQVDDEQINSKSDEITAENVTDNVESTELSEETVASKNKDNPEPDEEKSEADSEENAALYSDLFDGEAELDNFKRELYGDDYDKIEVQKAHQADASDSENDRSAHNEDDEEEDEDELDGIAMTVIKNDDKVSSGIDKQKLRESLNVIDGEKSPSREEDISDQTEEVDEQQLLMNRNVLDKVKKYEEETADQKEEIRRASAERTAKAYEREFGAVEPITEIEITDYITPNSVDEVRIKAGKFSECVKSEYEFYVGYTRLKSVAKSQSRVSEKKTDGKNAESVKNNEQRFSEFSGNKFAKSRDRLDDVTKKLDYKDSKAPNALEYRSEEDAEKVKRKLQSEHKRSKARWTVSLIITIVTFILYCNSGRFASGAGDAASGSERIFAVINFILYGGIIYVCRDIIINGLRPLRKIKTNCDTGVSLAAAAVGLQSLIAVFTPASFFRRSFNIYSLIIMLILAMYSLGGYLNAKRAAANFRFVSDSSQKYTGKFFHDQRMVATLLSGTRTEKSELVFQKKTSFLKHFVKLSKSPDPGESISSKFTLPALVFAVVISVIYCVLSKSFVDAVSVLAITLCMAVPMCGKALGAIPLQRLSKDSLANQAMVVGYPAVEHFSESAAIMLDAKELYPEGSVHLNGIKTFDQRRVDDAMLAAASVIISAGGAMAGMFDGIILGDKQEALPTAESVMYEDGRGIIGWVNNERIFVGNRQLLIAHGIDPMPVEYEDEQRSDGDEILYLACAGELVAMFKVGYSANRRVADVLRRMEANGMSLLIRTTDVNITAERISKDFGICYGSIKILEQKSSNVIRDEMIGKEKSSPALIATKGGVTSFGRAVSGCIKAKKDISLSLALQIVGVLLGLLIVTTIVLFAGIQHIGSIQMFIFALLWNVIVLIAPAVLQKIQKY